MENKELFSGFEAEITKLLLTDNYRVKTFKNSFDRHLEALIETSDEIIMESKNRLDNSVNLFIPEESKENIYELNRDVEKIMTSGKKNNLEVDKGRILLALENSEKSTLNSKDLKITNALYYQMQNYILEELDDINEETLEKIDDLEIMLYDKVFESLGKNYNATLVEDTMIDSSIQKALLSLKFNCFTKNKLYSNPWLEAKNILFQSTMLHTFSTNVEDFFEYGLKLNKNESEITKYSFIGVLGKGNRVDFTTALIRDLVRLRSQIMIILEDLGRTSSKPIKGIQIIDIIRKLGIDTNEMTDNQIRNWLISPLKRANRLGSCGEGYFIVLDCKDLEISYSSHFENLKGYFRTLEKHLKASKNLGCTSDFDFTKHQIFLNKYDL